MAAEQRDDDARELQIGYRAYLVKDGEKIVLAVSTLEYDPNASVLTKTQREGVTEVFQQFYERLAISPMEAVATRYDPFRTKQNTGGSGGHRPAGTATGDDPTS